MILMHSWAVWKKSNLGKVALGYPRVKTSGPRSGTWWPKAHATMTKWPWGHSGPRTKLTIGCLGPRTNWTLDYLRSKDIEYSNFNLKPKPKFWWALCSPLSWPLWNLVPISVEPRFRRRIRKEKSGVGRLGWKGHGFETPPQLRTPFLSYFLPAVLH
jgi:hypothetical protein